MAIIVIIVKFWKADLIMAIIVIIVKFWKADLRAIIVIIVTARRRARRAWVGWRCGTRGRITHSLFLRHFRSQGSGEQIQD